MTSVQIGCVMLIGGIYTHLGRYVTRAVASGPSPFWFIHPCPEDTSGDTTEPPATSLYHHLAAYEDDYHIQSLTMELIELFVKNCDHHDIKTHVYLHKFVFETLGYVESLTMYSVALIIVPGNDYSRIIWSFAQQHLV